MTASSDSAARSPILWLLLGLLCCEYFTLGHLLHLDVIGLDRINPQTFEFTFEDWFEATNGVIALGLLSSINFAITGISYAVSIEGGEMAQGKAASRIIGYFWWTLKTLVLADILVEILIWPLGWGIAGVCSWTMLITAKKLAQSIYSPGHPESTKRLWKVEAAILATLSIVSATAGSLVAPHFNLLGFGSWGDALLLY